jgi:hypothetical protein
MFKPLATMELNVSNRYWRTLGHHQTPKVPSSQRCLELHIRLIPINLRCLSLLTSRMRKNPRRTLRTSRTKAYRRDTKTNYTAVKEMGWGFLAFRLFLQPSTQEKSCPISSLL